jgi:hypothetical protein
MLFPTDAFNEKNNILLGPCWSLFGSRLLTNITTYTHQGPTNFEVCHPRCVVDTIGRVFCSLKSQLFMLWYNRTYFIK